MPECQGQNARVLFDGDEITIVREGLAAKLNFVDPHPWQIPVAALTGVDLQPPGALRVGRLQFLIKGASVHHGSTAELTKTRRSCSLLLLDGGSSRSWRQMSRADRGQSASRPDSRYGRAAACTGGPFECAQTCDQMNRGACSQRGVATASR